MKSTFTKSPLLDSAINDLAELWQLSPNRSQSAVIERCVFHVWNELIGDKPNQGKGVNDDERQGHRRSDQ